MTKIAIYTANVGQYDLLRQPYFPHIYHEFFDFICFSDSIDRSHVGVWKIRKIDYHHSDNTRIARYVKLHPHILLSDYSSTIWIDSNIEIIGSTIYENGLEMSNNKIIFSSLKHPYWNCAYQDGYNCVRNYKDSFTAIKKHLNFLHSEGYPKNNGLFETQIVYRNNQSDVIKIINNEWWRIMGKFSRRDQLSINYLLWKHNLSFNFFLGDACARDHDDFFYHSHSADLGVTFPVFCRVKILNFFKEIRGRILARFL